MRYSAEDLQRGGMKILGKIVKGDVLGLFDG
jgi:hypothetical protein